MEWEYKDYGVYTRRREPGGSTGYGKTSFEGEASDFEEAWGLAEGLASEVPDGSLLTIVPIRRGSWGIERLFVVLGGSLVRLGEVSEEVLESLPVTSGRVKRECLKEELRGLVAPEDPEVQDKVLGVISGKSEIPAMKRLVEDFSSGQESEVEYFGYPYTWVKSSSLGEAVDLASRLSDLDYKHHEIDPAGHNRLTLKVSPEDPDLQEVSSLSELKEITSSSGRYMKYWPREVERELPELKKGERTYIFSKHVNP